MLLAVKGSIVLIDEIAAVQQKYTTTAYPSTFVRTDYVEITMKSGKQVMITCENKADSDMLLAEIHRALEEL